MDISPVSLEQVVAGRDGRRYEISGQAGALAKQIQELDPTLTVQFNEGGMFFMVLQRLDSISGQPDVAGERLEGVLVVPMDEWDGRVLKNLEVRAHEVRNGISAAARIEAKEAAAKKAADDRFTADIGERTGPLMHAMQRDVLGIKPRIFVPGR